MKRLILLFSFCLLQGVALAQWSVGIRGGVNSTSIDRSHFDRIDETYESLSGYNLGLYGRYTINPWLAVRADLNLMQRSHRLQRHLNYLSPVYTDHINTYLLLPVMADFSFGGSRLRGHLLLGGFVGYWLEQRVKGVTYGMTDYEVFFNDFDERRAFAAEYNRFDAGLAGGIGFSYSVTDHIDLNFDALLYYDLLSHHNGYANLQDYRYLNTGSLTIGISYKLIKKGQQ